VPLGYQQKHNDYYSNLPLYFHYIQSILSTYAVPTGSQANMHLWYSTLGLYQPKQQKYHTKIPE
jgi:hypothetical protein